MASVSIGLSLLIPVILVVLIAGRLILRITRNRKGTKYSVRSIFTLPIIYLIISLFFMIGLSLLEASGLLLAIAIGILAGLQLGKHSEIFEHEGKVMYKRSAEVMAIWIVGFLIRIGIDFYANPSLFTGNFSLTSFSAYESSPLLFGADILLAFSAGLLLGEALILYKRHKAKYSGSKQGAKMPK